MRLTIDLLGHHLDIRLDHPGGDTPTGSDQPLDSLVETADRHDVPTLGFAPTRPLEDRR